MDNFADYLSDSSSGNSGNSVWISNGPFGSTLDAIAEHSQDALTTSQPAIDGMHPKRHGRKPKKKKAKVVSAMTSTSTTSSNPLPVRPNFRSFLERYISCFNMHSIECFRKLITTNAESDVVFISRHWRRNDVRAEAPMNPLGMYNYCEMHGYVDILSNHRILMSLIPDMCIYYQDIRVKEQDQDGIVAIVQIHIVGTIVSCVRGKSLGDVSIHDSVLSQSCSSDASPFTSASSRIDSHEQKISLCALLFQEDHFAAAWNAKQNSLSRRLLQAPELSLGPLHGLVADSTPHSALSPPLPPLPVSSSDGVVLSSSSSAITAISVSSSHLPVPSRMAGESSTPQLIRLPVKLRGLLICHFASRVSERVNRLEMHYYDPPEVSKDGEREKGEMQDGVPRRQDGIEHSSSASSDQQLEDGKRVGDGISEDEVSPALLLLLLRQPPRPLPSSRHSRKKEVDGNGDSKEEDAT